jgi:8-amino-7-oxononanoate synthase
LSSRSLDDFAARKLESLERRHLKRKLEVTDRVGNAELIRGDTRLLSFACNDYLGLAAHPAVIEASIEATRHYGAGAAASRLITGNHPLYRELEERLAVLKGAADAVVFGSGYLTNVGVIPLLSGPRDLVLVDELAHSCILVGAALGRGRVVEFPHNDVDAVRRVLVRERAAHAHCLLVTDGVFSMEGDLAPLPELAALADEHDVWLMTDDAHGLGVVGAGRGSSFAHGVPVSVPLQMGTLSKAVGGYGGYLCASRPVAELVRNRARSFVYSTGLAPGTVAAAAKALEIIASDAELVERPLNRAREFTQALGLPAALSPIVSLRLGSAERALEASWVLREYGFLVPAIRPPTVPAGTSRLRFAFSALHSSPHVDALVDAIERAGIFP